MDAGREFDAKVAELLGWRKVTLDSLPNSAIDYTGIPPDSGMFHRVLDWSTSWAAMKEVVEAMQGRGWEWSLLSGDDTSKQWEALLEKYDVRGNLESVHNAVLPTLPHAVCEAAIKAMEAE